MPFVQPNYSTHRSFAENEASIDVQRRIWRNQPDFWSEAVPAAFTLENTVGSLRDHMKFPMSGLPDNPNFDQYDVELNRGTIFERFPELLLDIDNEEDWEIMRKKATREWQQQRLVAQSPYAFGAYLLAGLLDPVNLIPVGVGMNAMRHTASLLKISARAAGSKMIRRGAKAGFIGNIYAEIPLHLTQEMRTKSQSAMNITAGTLLGGVIGTVQVPWAIKRRAQAEIYAAFGQEAEKIRGQTPSEPIIHVRQDRRAGVPEEPRSLVTDQDLETRLTEIDEEYKAAKARLGEDEIISDDMARLIDEQARLFNEQTRRKRGEEPRTHTDSRTPSNDADAELLRDAGVTKDPEGLAALYKRVSHAEKATEEITVDPVTGKKFTAIELMDQLESEGKPRLGKEFSERRGYSAEEVADHQALMTRLEAELKAGADEDSLMFAGGVISGQLTRPKAPLNYDVPLPPDRPIHIDAIEATRDGTVFDHSRPIIALDDVDVTARRVDNWHWTENTRTTHGEAAHTTSLISASELLRMLPELKRNLLMPPKSGGLQLRRPRLWVRIRNPNAETPHVAAEMEIVAFNETESLAHLLAVADKVDPRVPVEIVVVNPTKAQAKKIAKGQFDPSGVQLKKFPRGKVPKSVSLGRLRAHALATEPNSIRLDRSITCSSPCRTISNEDILREGETVPGGYHQDGTIGISKEAVEMDTGGAYNPDVEATAAEMKSAMGMEKLIGFMFPSIRMATSRLKRLRQIAPKLVNMDLRMEQFAGGIPRSRSAELGIKVWNRHLGEVILEQDQAWARSRAELAGRNVDRNITAVEIAAMDARDLVRGAPDGGMTKHQFFDEVGLAMEHQLNGQPGSTNKWVEKAATETRKRYEAIFSAAEQVGIIEPIKRVDAQGRPDTRIYAEDGSEIAQSYFPHLPKKQYLRTPEGRQAFIDMVSEKWQQKYEDMGALEAETGAEKVYDHWMGTANGRLAEQRIPGLDEVFEKFGKDPPELPGVREIFDKPDINQNRRPGATRPRTLDIHARDLEPFLVHDVQIVTRHLFRTMIPDIEIARNFGYLDLETGNWKGDPNMTAALRDLVEELEEQVVTRTKRGDTPESIAAFEKRSRRDIEDIGNMRDLLRGQYAVPANPEHGVYAGMQSFRMVNYITMGGGFMLSSIPDISRLITVNGLAHTFDTAWNIMMTPKGVRKSLGSEARLAGSAWEVLLNQRAANIFDLADDFGRMTRAQMGLRAGADRFATLSLLSPWNDMMKRWSGIYSGQLMAKHIDDWVNGRATKAQIEKMAYWGFDYRIAKKIHEQYKGNKVHKNELWDLKSDTWTDREAKDAFRLALVGEIDRTIITPGAADVPLFLNTEVGRTVFQFKRFALAATKVIAFSGAQWRDMQALNGAMVGIAMGAIVAEAKAAQYGYTIHNKKDMILQAVDRSGILGIIPDINKSMGLFSGGALAPGQVLFGGSNRYKYTEQDFTDVLFGPTRGTIRNIFKVESAAKKLITGNWDQIMETEIRALARISGPYSLFYLTQMFEHGIDTAAGPGVRARRENKKAARRQEKADNAAMIAGGEYAYLEMAYEDHGVDGLVSLVNERNLYRNGKRGLNLVEQMKLESIITDADLPRIRAASQNGGIAAVVKYLKERLKGAA